MRLRLHYHVGSNMLGEQPTDEVLCVSDAETAASEFPSIRPLREE